MLSIDAKIAMENMVSDFGSDFDLVDVIEILDRCLLNDNEWQALEYAKSLSDNEGADY